MRRAHGSNPKRAVVGAGPADVCAERNDAPIAARKTPVRVGRPLATAIAAGNDARITPTSQRPGGSQLMDKKAKTPKKPKQNKPKGSATQK